MWKRGHDMNLPGRFQYLHKKLPDVVFGIRVVFNTGNHGPHPHHAGLLVFFVKRKGLEAISIAAGPDALASDILPPVAFPGLKDHTCSTLLAKPTGNIYLDFARFIFAYDF